MKTAVDIWNAVEGSQPSARRIILSAGRGGGKTYSLMKSARNCAMHGGNVLVVVAQIRRVEYTLQQLLALWPDEHDFPGLVYSSHCVLFPGGGKVSLSIAERGAIMAGKKPDMLCLDNVDDFPQPWEHNFGEPKWYRDTRSGPDKIEVEFAKQDLPS